MGGAPKTRIKGENADAARFLSGQVRGAGPKGDGRNVRIPGIGEINPVGTPDLIG